LSAVALARGVDDDDFTASRPGLARELRLTLDALWAAAAPAGKLALVTAQSVRPTPEPR
jgi:hypothetical protein